MLGLYMFPLSALWSGFVFWGHVQVGMDTSDVLQQVALQLGLDGAEAAAKRRVFAAFEPQMTQQALLVLVASEAFFASPS